MLMRAAAPSWRRVAPRALTWAAGHRGCHAAAVRPEAPTPKTLGDDLRFHHVHVFVNELKPLAHYKQTEAALNEFAGMVCRLLCLAACLHDSLAPPRALPPPRGSVPVCACKQP